MVPPRDNLTEARYVSLIWHDCPSSKDPLIQELAKFCLSESTAACVSLAQSLARDSPVVHRSSLARMLHGLQFQCSGMRGGIEFYVLIWLQ